MPPLGEWRPISALGIIELKDLGIINIAAGCVLMETPIKQELRDLVEFPVQSQLG